MAEVAREKLRDVLLVALGSYRCQYAFTTDSEHLPLIDALSPGVTIAEGRMEIELLADYLVGIIEDSKRKEDRHCEFFTTTPNWNRDCSGDGHYECRECGVLDPDSLMNTENGGGE